MIAGLQCRHCEKKTDCMESFRGTPCRDFLENWTAIREDEDPAIRKQGRAQYKRICRKAREEATAKRT